MAAPATSRPAGPAGPTPPGGAPPPAPRTNVYCHGAGPLNSTAPSPRLHRPPLWTGGTPEAECGTCHGVPPIDVNHMADMPLQSCTVCHARTIDMTGHILV